MDKILAEVFLPAEDVSYDVLLPQELKIREVIQLLSQAFSDLSDGCYEKSGDTFLCDRKTGKILDGEHSVYELALHNGSSLMLI